MNLNKCRGALTITIVILFIVGVTRYSGVASALPASPTKSSGNIFFADDIACAQRGNIYIPGSIERGTFVSLTKTLRELRAKITHTVSTGRTALQDLRQEYKALKLRKEMYAHTCAAGPQQIQSLAKATKMTISSTAFVNKGVIPDEHSCWVTGTEDPGEGSCQFPPFLNTHYAISSSGCSSAPQGREGAWGRLITCE